MAEVNASAAQYSLTVGGERFEVLHFQAYEEISQLSRYSLHAWSENPEVGIAALVRQEADIKLSWAGKEKHFRGIVSSITQTGAGRPGPGGVEREWGEYTVEVVPTLWLLNQKTNCRIFQEMTTDAIIKKVLDGRGMAGKVDPRLGACPKREYCVQYRETDYAFICRLMQEEGVFFYFTHDGKETMVIGDSPGHFEGCVPDAEVFFRTGSGGLAAADEYLSSLSYTEAATIGKVVFKDYDYRNPTQPLKVEKTAPRFSDMEIYDHHPERYSDEGRGRKLAEVLRDAEACWARVIQGDGTWRSVSAGGKVTISRAYRGDLDGEWLVTRMTHTASQRADTGVEYATSFYAIPSSVVFRPFPSVPKPALNPQTATVVGPGGATIHMDELGRAKVQFHWDLEGKHDEQSSCYIRVAQPFAGMDKDTQKKHGFQWHPQIGDEVVVDFLEGDPDKPLIVGSVYNADNAPLIKPEELIRQMILTRYQHRLLMDDANGSITLNTGGNQRLVESDKGEGQGRIVLGTSGKESVVLEDGEDDFGNMIRIQTADAHRVILAEKGERRGIAAMTRNEHLVLLDDHEDKVKITTKAGHEIELNQPWDRITVRTPKNRILTISDADERLYLEGVDGTIFMIADAMQKILLESGNHAVALEMDYGIGRVVLRADGNISVEAGGELHLSGKKVVVESATDAIVKANDITLNASGDVKVKAGGDIEAKAQGDAALAANGNASVSGLGEASLDAKGKASVSGAVVDVSGQGIVTVSGAVVKIN